MAKVTSVEADLPPPGLSGYQREEYAPGTAYRRGDPVWVWSTLDRQWCVGIVDAASRIALQVTYTRTDGRGGTASDAVPPCYVARRSTAGQAAETSPSPG